MMEIWHQFHHGSVVTVCLALLFAFSNGFRDSSTIVATVVSTRVLTPTAAFILCALFEFGGALLLGSAVATTIGRGMFSPTLTSSKSDVLVVLGSALFSAFMWGVISWWRAWPTSNNHALFAGLAGASWAMMGVTPFHNKILRLVLGVLILSPILGFALSTVLTALLRYLGEWITIRMKSITDGLHVMACLMVSCAHGSNDGQMVMGALLLALGMIHIQTGSVGAFVVVPGPIRFAVAGAIALGVLLGGRRILKQMGMKFYRIRDVQGLGAQLTAAGTVLTCTMIGFPASTTQVVAGSIVGAGVAKNPRAVRWHIAQEIILSWFMTLPTVGLLSYVVCRGVAWFLR